MTKKKAVPVGEDESVQNIESRLPPLKGQKASVVEYIRELELVETRLYVWDMQRARHMEFQLLADQLLKIIGGGLGVRYDPSKPAIIDIGLGQFSTRSGLSSLHSSFLMYFIQKARSLVYHHRDVLAAENMANIIQEYLARQERPDYLHPVAEDGSLPWKARQSSSSSCATTTSNASSSTIGVQGRLKRASNTSSPEPQKSCKSLKSSQLIKASKATKS
ncbi:hypothetical protein BGZ89_011535 [Linnemannia elongata]|nr:hypothetical protein BGZ89_011535 [Linnemannia elongata]